MHGLFYHGTQDGLIELPSLADGLAGPVEAGSITIPLVRRYVDDFVLISEDEIIRAIRFAWAKYQQRIEASAAVVIASVLSGKVTERPVVAVVSGGNIQPELHAQIVEGDTWNL
jgi:threonine dehydratase